MESWSSKQLQDFMTPQLHDYSFDLYVNKKLPIRTAVMIEKRRRFSFTSTGVMRSTFVELSSTSADLRPVVYGKSFV